MQIVPIRDLRNTNEISERCRQSAEPIFVTKNGYGDMVIMSMETYERTVAMAEVYRKLMQAEAELDAGKAVAVDVREPDEYAVGHIPGAKLLPLGEVNSRAAEVLPEKEATWLVYCRTGRRSAEAVQKLDALGYSNLYDLGGILSWPYEIEGDFEGHF